MSLRRLAAACVWPGFEGHEPPEWVRRRLSEGLGGVCLFSWNIGSAEEVAALTAALRAEQPDVVVSTDEEGGDVTRLEALRGSSYPGNLALGAVDDVDLTRDVARSIGSDLAAVGIDLNFAPVADVNTNPDNPVIGTRSFGADAALVSRHVAAYVTGLQEAGVAACAKHFPGHGDTAVDSHLELPVVERIEEEALAPFRAAVDAGVRAVMTAHIRVSSLGQEPSTVSAAVLGMLREELGFEALIVTDALEMKGIADSVGVEQGAVLALAAGADALLLGHDLADADVESVLDAIEAAVAAGRLSEERLAEAAARVAAVRFSEQVAACNLPGIGAEAARRAVRVEGDARLVRPACVVEFRPGRSVASDPSRHTLGEMLGSEVVPVVSQNAHDIVTDPAIVAGCNLPGNGAGKQLVLVVQDVHRHDWEREAAEALLARVPDAVVVEIGIPEWRPPNGAAFVATYGGGRANLEAAARLLQGADR